jgi:Grx4 family monothiol glutaredoxin
MTKSQVVDVTTIPATGQKAVLLFWAPWHEASTEGGPMDQVLRAFASTADNTEVLFGRVNAEECSSLVQHYQVSFVPTFVLLHSDGPVEKVEGGDDLAKITQSVQRLLQATTTTTSPVQQLSPEEQIKQRLQRLITSAEVMLFIKGTPEAPKCGFSRQAMELLQDEHIPFGSFDILSDEVVRQELKTYSDWPTYPQLYVRGELMGGLDIMKELKQEEGGLRQQLQLASTTAPSLQERLAALVKRHRVMLFMKGLPSAPRCGFSRQIVQLLDEEHISYDSFDILQDDQVREGLKKFSDWPTYPQLYVDGELVGGLDIVTELKEESGGSLKEALGI